MVITEGEHKQLFDLLSKKNKTELTINLDQQQVTTAGGFNVTFPIDVFAKACLLNDVDELGYILRFEPEITEYENSNL